MPAVGGGICQLSNAIFEVATKAGATIVERHAHSRIVPGSAAERGADATVAWNYVDLRFTLPEDAVLEAYLTQTDLVVRLLTRAGRRRSAGPDLPVAQDRTTAQACDTCGMVQCYRHAPAPSVVRNSAVLVEGAAPEWQDWLRHQNFAGAMLLAPLDGRRWKRSQYDWPLELFDRKHFATIPTLVAAWRERRQPPTNGARQAKAMDRSAQLTRSLLDHLPHTTTDLIITHELLPFAWLAGALSGRRFTVLLGRLPISVMQASLDEAAAIHGQSATLADFRADAALAAAETAALAAATQIVTPHTAAAELLGDRCQLVPWRLPKPEHWNPGPALAFGGPTVGRKGAYEVREAVRRLNLPLVVLAGNFEGDGFWDGIDVRVKPRSDSRWLDGCFALAQPAIVEERPRALLQATSNGVPTIATPACGIKPTLSIPALDVDALVDAITSLRARPGG